MMPRMALRLMMVALAVVALQSVRHGMSDARAGTTADGGDKPYTVKDGKVDHATYKGYLYYGDACLRCHGPDGAGSSYAPSLVDSLKTLSKDKFVETVINGKQEVNTAQQRVMPALGTNEDVVNNLDNIYAYLKARSDGVVPRGHPDRIED